MARITVEDCVTVVPNRFELCLVASNRAKSILSGSATTLDRKEKPAVISLREIAEGMVDVENVKRNIVRSIKNRGVVEIVSSNEEITNLINEEAEGTTTTSSSELKDTTFVDENVQVDD
jgi:DNA-directed RNA polymerase subunit omega